MKIFLFLNFLFLISCGGKYKNDIHLRVNSNVTLSFENNNLEFIFSDTLYNLFPKYRFVYYSRLDSIFMIISYENREKNRLSHENVEDILIYEPKNLIEFSPNIVFHKKGIINVNQNRWCEIYFEMYHQHEMKYIAVLNGNDILSISIRSLPKAKDWKMPYWVSKFGYSLYIEKEQNNYVFNEVIKKIKSRRRFW